MDEIRVLLATHREPVHQKSALATAPEGAHVTICAAARYETVVERIATPTSSSASGRAASTRPSSAGGATSG